MGPSNEPVDGRATYQARIRVESSGLLAGRLRSHASRLPLRLGTSPSLPEVLEWQARSEAVLYSPRVFAVGRDPSLPPSMLPRCDGTERPSSKGGKSPCLQIALCCTRA